MTTPIDYEATGPNYAVDKLLDVRERVHQIIQQVIDRGRADGTIEDAGPLSVRRLDDQHAYLAVPDGGGLSPGDLVGFGISHPCTTLDKWRVIPVVDDDYQVIDAVHTFF